MRKKDYSEHNYKFYWTNIAISLLIITVLTILVLYMPGLRNFDSNVLNSIQLALSPYPKYIPQFISTFGYANYLLWPQITAVCVLISHAKYLKAFLLVFFVNSSFWLLEIIKNYVCRERPCTFYEGFSFPSGHSTVIMCFLGIIIYLILSKVSSKFWKYLLTTSLGLWILLVGISRLWLGVHFLTDVIAGWTLGFIFVNLYIILDKFFKHS